jgi:mono/diheme cytochrome c family protein
MVLALSTGHEIGLAAAGAAFIGFALLSSFVFPRMSPDFPSKKGMLWYIPLATCFFVAMLAAVLVFGKEKAPAAAAAAAATTTASATTPSTGGKLTSGPYANGDPTAGKAVFASAGCGACHTLKAAAATGAIGPNLDKIAAYAQQGHVGTEQFIVSAVTHPPPAYVPPGFPTNVMPTTFGKSLSAKQIADLVAFVASSASG